MESSRTRTDPIPPKSRHQVLRPGVRIVAEQFAPYDDSPDEEFLYTILGLLQFSHGFKKKEEVLVVTEDGDALRIQRKLFNEPLVFGKEKYECIRGDLIVELGPGDSVKIENYTGTFILTEELANRMTGHTS